MEGLEYGPLVSKRELGLHANVRLKERAKQVTEERGVPYEQAMHIARSEQDKAVYARILKEDALFDIYGRAVQQRWRKLVKAHGYDSKAQYSRGYSYRLRRSRRQATNVGLMLATPAIQEWLAQYGIHPESVYWAKCVRTFIDKANVAVKTTLWCVARETGLTYEVTVPHAWPNLFTEWKSALLTCTEEKPARFDWRAQFEHPDFMASERLSAGIIDGVWLRCPNCNYRKLASFGGVKTSG